MADRILYCSDLRQDPDFPGCCDSCHDDNEEGYGDLCDRYDESSSRCTHIVCCRVNTWLDEKAQS